MLTTALACGAGLLVAVGLFLRERRLWRARGDLDGVLFQYSRRRFVRRAAGCALLGAVMVMTFLGLEVLDFREHLVAFQVYWAIVGACCLSLFVVPVLDMRETYRHLLRDGADARLRAELERIERDRQGKRAPDAPARPEGGPSRDGPARGREGEP